MKKVYLEPNKKLIDAVVEYVKSRASVEAPNHFDHLMIIVPTAESGRSLRLALAKEFCNEVILSPYVLSPQNIIKPADKNLKIVSDIELEAAFLSFIKENDVARYSTLFHKSFLDQKDSRAFLGFLKQLNEIWSILAGNALSMQDVLENEEALKVLEKAEGQELERWNELADFEKTFFAYLENRKLCPYARYVKEALRNPSQLPKEIKEVILPSLVDPIHVIFPILEKLNSDVTILVHAKESNQEKFDKYGIPIFSKWANDRLEKIDNSDIFCATTNEALGAQVAKEFFGKKNFPALGLIDQNVLFDVQGGLLDVGIYAYSPEQHYLHMSSLGALIERLIFTWDELRSNGQISWQIFKSFFVCHDVMCAILSRDATISRLQLLKEIDLFANKFFPSYEPNERQLKFEGNHISFKCFSKATSILKSLFDENLSLSKFIRKALKEIYLASSDNKEFRAAVNSVQTMLNELELIEKYNLTSSSVALIAKDALYSSAYQLEPDDETDLKTLGWLELAWSDKNQIALSGFHEGAVPDALVGHSFLPNSLRVALKLTSNEQRFARDVFLLNELLESRRAHDVKFFVARSNAAGEIQKPSRLLFLTDDKNLPLRAKHLFDEIALGNQKITQAKDPLKYDFPSDVKLPNAKEGFLGSVSPSSLDTYLKNPFEYFLKYGLKLERFKTEIEIPANDYGSLAHEILERFAKCHLNCALVPDEVKIHNELSAICDEVIEEIYGPKESISTNTFLQTEALKNRVSTFAKVQAKWASEGWQIFAAEYKLNKDGEVFPFKKHPGVALRGSIDRIDFHPSYGYRLIDYKTWDRKKDSLKKVISSSEDDIQFMKDRELKIFAGLNIFGRECDYALMTIQLPLYARALEVKDFKRFGGKIYDMAYLILGESDSQEDSGVFLSRDSGEKNPLITMRDTADEVVDKLLEQLLSQKFLHPTTNTLQYDFGEFFDANIKRNLDDRWMEKAMIKKGEK